jgi:hypothetical protein
MSTSILRVVLGAGATGTGVDVLPVACNQERQAASFFWAAVYIEKDSLPARRPFADNNRVNRNMPDIRMFIINLRFKYTIL